MIKEETLHYQNKMFLQSQQNENPFFGTFIYIFYVHIMT